MGNFLVKFSDVAFTADSGFDGIELAGQAAKDTSRALKASMDFPKNVIEVHSASVFNDDDQPQDGEYKVFTSITLLVQARSEEAAESFPVPQQLLSAVASYLESMSPGSFENEGNWEVLEVDATDQASTEESAASLKAARP